MDWNKYNCKTLHDAGYRWGIQILILDVSLKQVPLVFLWWTDFLLPSESAIEPTKTGKEILMCLLKTPIHLRNYQDHDRQRFISNFGNLELLFEDGETRKAKNNILLKPARIVICDESIDHSICYLNLWERVNWQDARNEQQIIDSLPCVHKGKYR